MKGDFLWGLLGKLQKHNPFLLKPWQPSISPSRSRSAAFGGGGASEDILDSGSVSFRSRYALEFRIKGGQNCENRLQLRCRNARLDPGNGLLPQAGLLAKRLWLRPCFLRARGTKLPICFGLRARSVIVFTSPSVCAKSDKIITSE